MMSRSAQRVYGLDTQQTNISCDLQGAVQTQMPSSMLCDCGKPTLGSRCLFTSHKLAVVPAKAAGVPFPYIQAQHTITTKHMQSSRL